jgi:putative ATP-binding cassette transporter
MNTSLVTQNNNDDRTTSDRFDRVFWERFWRLIRPYWASDRRGRGLVLLSAITALNLATVGMQAVFSYVSRDVMNSLQAKDAPRFHHLLMLFALWIMVFVPIAAFYPYLSGLLSIDWRDWMTERFVKGMLRGNALYYIMRDHTVDNPDQRISEDVNSFSNGALSYSMTVLQAIVTAITFFGILWAISRWLAVSLIGYALAGSGDWPETGEWAPQRGGRSP